MASNTIYVIEAVNLFCGDHDPTASKHLTLSELALPSLEGVYADHTPGGGPVGIEIEVGISKLEPTFKLNGIDPDLMQQFGLGSKLKRVFTAYGVANDKRSGRKIEVKSIMEGRLGKVSPSAFQRGELQSHDYAINEVTHYEVWFDSRPLIKWDFFNNQWEVGGVDENGETNSILRIT